MRNTLLTLFAIQLLLVSCVPSGQFKREPKSEAETLVIGRVLLYNQRYKAGSVPIGKFRYGVQLEFEDADTGKKITTKAIDSKGFFYLHNPSASKIRLMRFSYHSAVSQVEYHPKKGAKKKQDKGATIAMKPNVKRLYELEAGKVNNLGYFEWTANMQNRTHNIKLDREYNETREAFTKRYPESIWNEKEWVTVPSEEP